MQHCQRGRTAHGGSSASARKLPYKIKVLPQNAHPHRGKSRVALTGKQTVEMLWIRPSVFLPLSKTVKALGKYQRRHIKFNFTWCLKLMLYCLGASCALLPVLLWHFLSVDPDSKSLITGKTFYLHTHTHDCTYISLILTGKTDIWCKSECPFTQTKHSLIYRYSHRTKYN